MQPEMPTEEAVERFLDRAWSQWKDYRPWVSQQKEIQPPGSGAARDDTRLLFRIQKDSAFMIGLRSGVRTVRVGLVTMNRWASEGIEQAVLDNGGSMTEFLEDEMEADDDLEYPMIHFHDSGEFYFLSEIPFESLDAPELYDQVVLYLKGYVIALEGHVKED